MFDAAGMGRRNLNRHWSDKMLAMLVKCVIMETAECKTRKVQRLRGSIGGIDKAAPQCFIRNVEWP